MQWQSRLILRLHRPNLNLSVRLALLEVPVRSMPLSMKGQSGVHDGQYDGGNRDHSTVKDHKVDLVIPELTTEAAPQLGRAKD